ncbi:EAL and HDOD domain-containing protein [Jatrophihabitans fulvus]
MGSLESVVGRQSIFRADELVGYELLFRPTASRGNRATGTGEMTAEVIFGALNIGLDVVAGDKLLFCTAGREVLTGIVPVVLPPERTVVQILPTVEVDDEVEAGVAALVEAGFGIALDEFGPAATTWSLLPHASVVKIDVGLTPRDDLRRLVERCRDVEVELLAERIEDRAAIPALAGLGFTLFQGYALERPTLVAGHSLAAADVAGLRAAVGTLGQDPDFDTYEDVIRRDPALAHQIMRMASYGRLGDTRRSITSVRQAMVVSGLTAVRRWLTLLLARPTTARGRDEALVNVLIRARACELLAAHLPGADTDMAFTAGLLSALDEVLEMPATDIAEHLTLSPDLHDAAFGGTSPLGRLVRDAAEYRYRPGGPVGATALDTRSQLTVEQIDAAFAEGFGWAFDTLAAAS